MHPIFMFVAFFLTAHAGESVREPASIRIHRDTPAPTADKSRYHLLNPTPDELLRDFSPDRPGSTNSPTTIDAGHFQLETELANYTRSADDLEKQINFPNFILRVGIDNSSEILIGWLTGSTRTTKFEDGSEEKITGLGDMMIGYKKNFLGNDGGPVAWAFGAGLKIPTNTNGIGNSKWEPTVTLPFSFNLFEDVGLSLTPQVDWKANESGNGYHTEFNNPFTLGYEVFEKVEAFAEFVTHSSNEPDMPTTAYFGIGFGAEVKKDVQFDLGFNLGLNPATPKNTILCGWTVRY